MSQSSNPFDLITPCLRSHGCVVILAEPGTDVTDSLPEHTLQITGSETLEHLRNDPLLTECNTLALTDAHSLRTDSDLALSLLLKAQQARKSSHSHDLGIAAIIRSQSAIDRLCRFLGNPETELSEHHREKKGSLKPVIELPPSPPRPVRIRYLHEPVRDYVDACVDVAISLHAEENARGDVLAFLPSEADVRLALTAARERAESSALVMCLFEDQPDWQKREACVQHSKPKIVLATPFAECDIAIDGIVHVVDSMFSTQWFFNASKRAHVQCTQPVDKATAYQRATRAGKEQIGSHSGICYRMCTESTFANLHDRPKPGVQADELTRTVLTIKGLGIDNLMNVDWVEPPPASHITLALQNLHALGAIDDDGKLTSPTGQIMTELDVDPFDAKALLASGELGCSRELIAAVACAHQSQIFSADSHSTASRQSRRETHQQESRAHSRFGVVEGDHLAYVNAMRAFLEHDQSRRFCDQECLHFDALQRAVRRRDELEKQLRRHGVAMGLSGESTEPLMSAIAAGYFMNAARSSGNDGTSEMYRTVQGNQPVRIHKSSCIATVPPSLIVYRRALQEEGQDCPRVYDVSSVSEEKLRYAAPHYFAERPA
jgi:ATP-dependent RNA helicase DDX35